MQEETKVKLVNCGGVTFDGLLAIAFIVLKLCGVIDWSWWWVLAPIWIPFALIIVIMPLVIIGVLIWAKKTEPELTYTNKELSKELDETEE